MAKIEKCEEKKVCTAEEKKIYAGKELFSGEYGKYLFTNFMEVEPWWYNDPTKFDKSTVVSVLSVNGTVLESEKPWYINYSWKMKADPVGTGRQPTRHDESNTIIYFCGTTPEKQWDLNAEIEFTIENEKHIINKPCAVYIPKGVKFGPISYTKLEHPVLQIYICPDTPWYKNALDEMHPETYESNEPIETYPMYGGKWGKCIITNPNRYEAAWYFSPAFDHSQYKDIVYLDGQALPGGVQPYNTCYQWKFKPEPPLSGHPENYHKTADEFVCFFGSDPEHPFDLGGEIEVTIGGEMHIVDRPCIVYIPHMMPHGPIWFRKVDRPMIQSFMLKEPYYYSDDDNNPSFNEKLRREAEAEGTL